MFMFPDSLVLIKAYFSGLGGLPAQRLLENGEIQDVKFISFLILRRNLAFLNKNQINAVSSVDPEFGRGELVITISSEAQHLIQEGKALRVGIEFSLERPQAGVHFVVPNCEGTLAEVRTNLL